MDNATRQRPHIMELIDNAPWREAVTYRKTWPHEYVDRQEGRPGGAAGRVLRAHRAWRGHRVPVLPPRHAGISSSTTTSTGSWWRCSDIDLGRRGPRSEPRALLPRQAGLRDSEGRYRKPRGTIRRTRRISGPAAPDPPRPKRAAGRPSVHLQNLSPAPESDPSPPVISQRVSTMGMTPAP